MALVPFKKNRMAMGCFYILCGLYLAVSFADFLSPYSFENEDRNYTACQPTPIHFFNEKGKFTWPFVYAYQGKLNVNHQRIYEPQKNRKFRFRFFVKGDQYKFLWIIPCRIHLFGVDSPGKIFILGADTRGRDLFSRLLYGGRISLSIGLIGVLISFPIGLLVGGIAGYCGGKVDDLLMRICEMIMMAPSFYILLALRAVVPAHFNSVQVYFAIILIISFISWAGLARIIRGMCLSLKEREFVLAAKAMGLSDLAIIVKHILPHTLSYSIIAVTLSIPGYILAESALSFIGLGIVDPFASWGNMLSDAMSIVRIRFTPWILWPGFFIFLTVFCFNYMGDTLRDCLDPMYKGK